MTYKCLLVGLGNVGFKYDLSHSNLDLVTTHAKAIEENKSLSLIAGVDKDKESCLMFEKHYKRSTYSDLRKALKDTKPEIIILSTNTESRLDHIKTILSLTKPKAILCEKPLSSDVEEGKRILNLCEENGVPIFVNYIRRADPGVLEIGRRIREKNIKGPFKGVAMYSKGFLNNGSHLFDLLKLWLGNMTSFTLISSEDSHFSYDKDIDVILNFSDNSISFLALKENNFSHLSVDLYGANGLLKYNKFGREINWYKKSRDKNFEGYEILTDKNETIYSEMNIYQLNIYNQLIKALNSEDNNLCTGKEALTIVEDLFKILKCA